MISIMNGDHCHTSTTTMDHIGQRSMKGMVSRPMASMRELSTPKLELNMLFFHTRPATTGMIRNGVISRVRAMPRPRNCRSSSSARPVPTSTESSTADVVITIETDTALRKNGLEYPSMKFSSPTKSGPLGGTIFQSRRLNQMLKRKGTCVTAMRNSRAGRRGRRRRHLSRRWKSRIALARCVSASVFPSCSVIVVTAAAPPGSLARPCRD